MSGEDPRPVLPAGLAANPRLSRWLSVHRDGTISVHPGKVELGQGIATALAQIAADELDVDPVRIRMVPADTATGPDEGITAGSMSVQRSGEALRAACAQARAVLLGLAAARLGVPLAGLAVHDGEIQVRGGTARTSYWELCGGAGDPLDRDATEPVATKPVTRYRVVGTALPRLDIPDKVSGRPRFVQDLGLPGTLHGRLVRPPSPAAALLGVDDSAARTGRGVVAVVRDGRFLGVVAEHEEDAVSAAEALRRGCRWDLPEALPDEDGLAAFLTCAPSEAHAVERRRDDAARGHVTRSHSASYTRPYLAHASISPSCAVARWTAGGDGLEVWTHSQGIYPLRAALATALGVEPGRIVVRHVEGAGAYGHNGADDAALDAALLGRAAPGRPVLVQWSRQDEMAWEPYGPAALVSVSAGLDATGGVVTWRHEMWSNGHVNRPGPGPRSRLLAATLRAEPDPEPPPVAREVPPESGGGVSRNAVPGYEFPDREITSHVLTVSPLRTSSLRALGATVNVFAIESFMDELAAVAGADPLEYRLRHLRDPRGRVVLLAAARRAGWGTGTPAGGAAGGAGGPARGRGIGYARYKNTGAYCAVVADVEAEREVRVRRLTVAVDVGLAVNPDGVANQIEGGAIQATSWALRERVRFDRTRVTSDTWETYPILRFSEVPAVDVELCGGPPEPSVGAGEAAQGPTVAAVANGLAAALGVRVRDLPLTRERVLAAMGSGPAGRPG